MSIRCVMTSLSWMLLKSGGIHGFFGNKDECMCCYYLIHSMNHWVITRPMLGRSIDAALEHLSHVAQQLLTAAADRPQINHL